MPNVVQFPITRCRPCDDDDEETAIDVRQALERIRAHQKSAHLQLFSAVDALARSGQNLEQARHLMGKLRRLNLG